MDRKTKDKLLLACGWYFVPSQRRVAEPYNAVVISRPEWRKKNQDGTVVNIRKKEPTITVTEIWDSLCDLAFSRSEQPPNLYGRYRICVFKNFSLYVFDVQKYGTLLEAAIAALLFYFSGDENGTKIE